MSYFPPRRHPRIDFQRLPWVFSLQLPQAATADQPFRLEARNLSLGGIKFLCNRRFAVFEILHASFLEKKTGNLLASVQGKIVRVEEIDTGFGEKTYGIAMEFVAGADELTEHLQIPSPPPTAPK